MTGCLELNNFVVQRRQHWCMHSFSHWFIWKSPSGGQWAAFPGYFIHSNERQKKLKWGEQGGAGSELWSALGGKTHNMRSSLLPRHDVHKEKQLRSILSILKGNVHDCLPHNSDVHQIKQGEFWLSSTISFIGKSAHERRGHNLATVLFPQEVTALLCWMRKECILKMEEKNIQQKMLNGWGFLWVHMKKINLMFRPAYCKMPLIIHACWVRY